MKRIFLFLLLFGTLFSGLKAKIYTGAQANQMVSGSDLVRTSEQTGSISFIRFREDAKISLQALLSKRHAWMPANLEPGDFELMQSFTDKLGQRHHRYQVRQGGIPVEGGMVILHEENGHINSINGDFFKVAPATPSLSKAAALTIALNQVNALKYVWELPFAEQRLGYANLDANGNPQPSAELVYAPQDGKYKSGNFRLAWKIDVYAHEPLSRSWIFVDAQNGQVLYDLNRIHESDVNGTAMTGHSGTQTIVTDSTGPGNYRLREVGRGGGVNTYNLMQQTSQASAIDFTDTDNSWNNVNAALDEYATDAHFGAEMTYDYFFNNYGWDSYNNMGAPLNSYVHSGVGFDNAFWDGVSMTYGDGSGNPFTFPLTCLDVCGHELAHGVTEFSAGLIYADESGALNESFSDIFGTVIEELHLPGGGDWIIGQQVTAAGIGIRDMEDPHTFQNPATYGGTYWVAGADVHYNSGVQNHWFYILTQGDTATNDIGDAYSVPGLGMVKSGAIAFRNLSVYLTPSSDYADAGFYGAQAASDLYGNCSNEMIQTVNAWYAVGIGNQFSNVPNPTFSAFPTAYCTLPATVNFSNLSSPGISYFWDFGDGNTSTATSPSHTYNNWGQYTVKLVMTSCTGQIDSVSIPNYIDIDSSAICPISMSTGVYTTCSGLLLDPGGMNNYPDNSLETMTISPVGAASVILNFNSFLTEQGWDFLTIYDGPTTASIQIGSYSGANLPNGGTITSSGPDITLVFNSDQVINEAGFELTWSCVSANSPPIADLIGTPTFSCDGIVGFSDNSLVTPTSWEWAFGDGNTSTSQNPVHTYANSGTYDVSLIVCNSFGCDTVDYASYITVDYNSNACDTATVPTSGTITLTTCQGIVMDDGGIGDYSNNVNSLTIIEPIGAVGISLDFASFDMEQGFDYLTIYDGNSTSSPIVGVYSGNNLPNGGIINGTGGALTLEFSTDGSVVMPGFLANWVSYGANAGPNAAFSAPASAFLNTSVAFSDQSSNANSWSWDFGDGNQATTQSPTHTYTSIGLYNVILIVEDGSGCLDSTAQSINITLLDGLPAVPQMDIKLWPNPSTGLTNLAYNFSGTMEIKMQVTNLLGQPVFEELVTENETYIRRVDLTQVTKGVYFLKLESEAGIFTQKVVVE